MKKLTIWLSLLIFGIFAGCSYDDTDLWNKVNDLDTRVADLEAAVSKLNSQTSTLQQLLDKKLFIESITQDENGNNVLNFISANGELSSMTITNGKDGKDGKDGIDGTDGKDGKDGKDGIDGTDGKDGKDGKDGTDGKDGKDGQDATPPNIGVERDANGNYYWTIDGERILDSNGNPVQANGTAGANGQDGKTPTFKIEDGKWYISFDNGITWTGPYGQATGADGDSFFVSANLSADGNSALLTLIDGTVLNLAIYKEFNIAFDISDSLIFSGETKDITFKITGATASTFVEVFAKGDWKAEVLQDVVSAGILRVTAPADAAGLGRVIVFASDGAEKTIMRTLTFVSGQVEVSTTSSSVPVGGGTVSIDVQTNLDFTAEIDEDAQSWITLSGSRAYETRTETIRLNIAENTTPYTRTGHITLKHEGYVLETILVVQEPVKYDESEMVFRVDASKGSAGKVTCPTFSFPTTGGGAMKADWGDGTVDEWEWSSTSKTFAPSHTYEDATREYTLRITSSGTLPTAINCSQSAGTIADLVQWGNFTSSMTTVTLTYLSNLTHLTAPTASDFSSVTTFSLKNNKALRTIDSKLLKSATKLDNVGSMFQNCSALEEIPEDLFSECTVMRNFSSMFAGCSSLRNAPSFTATNGGTATTAPVNSMFQNCSSLTTLPEHLFNATFVAKISNMVQFFDGCSSLESVPDSFFDNFENNTMLKPSGNCNYFFRNCTSLKYVNFEKFFNVLGRKVISYTGSFMNCSSLEGTIPAYKFEYDGQTYNIYPWQRKEMCTSDDTAFNTALKAEFGITNTNYSGTNCFNGCYKLSGYYTEIPTAWGGGWDGTVDPPTLEVTATLQPNEEYHYVNFCMKGQRVLEAYYYYADKAYVDKIIPEYNNDYTALCKAKGNYIDSDYLPAINSTDGLTIYDDSAVYSTEYIFICYVKNMHGEVFKTATVTTSAIPAGDGVYDKYIGVWHVVSNNSMCEVSNQSGNVEFDIQIWPYRVNKSFAVTGWGVTQFRNASAIRFMYENGNITVYSGNSSTDTSMCSLVYEGYNYKDDFGDIDYNAAYTPYARMSDGNYQIYGLEESKLVEGKVEDTKCVLNGVVSTSLASAGLPNTECGGFEVFLQMGGYGWSRYFLPSDVVLPEYRYTVDGTSYAKLSLAPYTMTRTGDIQLAPQRLKSMHGNSQKSFTLKTRAAKVSDIFRGTQAVKTMNNAKLAKAKAKKRK